MATKKMELLKELKEFLYKTFNTEGYYPFFNLLTFHYDSSKYTLMEIICDEDLGWMVTAIGYNAFSVYHLKLDELSTQTLRKIKGEIEKVVRG